MYWRYCLFIVFACTYFTKSVWLRVQSLSWWSHQMETFSMLLAFCTGNSPVTGEFPTQRPMTQSFDVFFDLRLNQQLSKQLRRQCFEMPSPSLWCHCNVIIHVDFVWTIMVRSRHNFAHDTTAQLLWHVQNCALIGSSQLELKIILLIFLCQLWAWQQFMKPAYVCYVLCRCVDLCIASTNST